MCVCSMSLVRRIAQQRGSSLSPSCNLPYQQTSAEMHVVRSQEGQASQDQDKWDGRKVDRKAGKDEQLS